MSGTGESAAPNDDNPDLPTQVPDPMTDDKDVAEVATDADAGDAASADKAAPTGLSDDEADRELRHD